MKQRVLISVLPGRVGKSLLNAAPHYLESGSVGEHIRSLIERDQVVFFSEHLNQWSMGDSFERFLRPKKHLRCFYARSSVLYAMPRDQLRLRLPARDEEEKLLYDLLRHAMHAYRRVTPGAYLFVLRTVFGASGDEDFSNASPSA